MCLSHSTVMIADLFELKGYHRIMLSGGDHIRIRFEEIVQLILGTNGSGKSSLLAELSPLPAASGHFAKGGFKRIHYTHRGMRYELFSSFKDGGAGHHDFICDGVELNPGHTSKAQAELAREHFGWSNDLHQLMTGRIRFSTMGPAKRRDWIQRLSTVDYRYALSVFHKLAKKSRDTSGSLNRVNARLTQESNNLKMVEGDDVATMEARVATLRHEVNLLLTSQDPNAKPLLAAQSRLNECLQQAETLSRRILARKILPVEGEYTGMDQVMSAIVHLDGSINTNRALYQRATREYADLDALAADLGAIGEEIPEDLPGVVEKARAVLADTKARLNRFKDLQFTSRMYSDTQQVIPALLELFSLMPDNSDMSYSPKAVEESKQRRAEILQEIDRATNRLVQIHHRRQTINEARDMTCPSCKYVWRPGYSEAEVAELDRWESEQNAIVEAAQLRRKVEDEFMEKYDEVAAQYTRLRGYVNGYPTMAPLWSLILDNRLHLNKPNEQRSVFIDWSNDVTLAMQIHEQTERLTHLENLLRRQADGSLSQLGTRRQLLTDEIERLQQENKTLRIQRDQLDVYRRESQVQIDDAMTVHRTIMAAHEAVQAVVGALRNNALNQVAYGHQDELATIQRRLSDRQTLTGIVDDLTRFRDQEQLDHAALALLADELSPTEGMIAEDLVGFITCLVEQINSIIAQVWTLDLQVKPCGLESGELNYKFPVYSPASIHKPAGDIDQASEGQQAMIDMAFVMTVMLYLDLHEAPLFLDEPGRTFDDQHRINLMGFIRQLVDSAKYPQFFIISHYASNHGAFTKADVIALDTTNVAVPQNCNQNVTLL